MGLHYRNVPKMQCGAPRLYLHTMGSRAGHSLMWGGYGHDFLYSLSLAEEGKNYAMLRNTNFTRIYESAH